MAYIRGAVCADNNENDISKSAVELVSEIIRRNDLHFEDVQAVFFTCTKDLDACYPADAVRHVLGGHIAYSCAQEMNVEGSLDHCIRVCVVAEGLSQRNCKHVYLGVAAKLRPDLQ